MPARALLHLPELRSPHEGTDRNIGFTREPKGCAKCGFAFLFELLDDYYPAPDAAFFVCDGEGRIVGCGKDSFAFTGLRRSR